jgi:ABC-type dipeptide/oligopeptide/nickel transport system permease component
MRGLSAVGFFISIVALLLVFYVQFGILPSLETINAVDINSNEFSNNYRIDAENNFSNLSLVALILGVFSVIFCSSLYLMRKTRMTMLGTIFGLIVSVFGMIYLFF